MDFSELSGRMVAELAGFSLLQDFSGAGFEDSGVAALVSRVSELDGLVEE